MPDIQDAIAACRANDFAAARALGGYLAAGGDGNAHFLLGLLAFHGQGGPRDLTAAAAHYYQAAAAGHPGAMLFLGRLYAAGEGGFPPDVGLAALWFFRAWQEEEDEAEAEIIRLRADLEAAAAGGAAEAQNALGLILCFGHDDPLAAAAWFEKAAAQGHPESRRMLDHLRNPGPAGG